MRESTKQINVVIVLSDEKVLSTLSDAGKNAAKLLRTELRKSILESKAREDAQDFENLIKAKLTK